MPATRRAFLQATIGMALATRGDRGALAAAAPGVRVGCLVRDEGAPGVRGLHLGAEDAADAARRLDRVFDVREVATDADAERLARDRATVALVGVGDGDDRGVVAAAARHGRPFLGIADAPTGATNAFAVAPPDGAYLDAVVRWVGRERPRARWLVVVTEADDIAWRKRALGAAQSRGATSVAEAVVPRDALRAADVLLIGARAAASPAIAAAIAAVPDALVVVPSGDVAPSTLPRRSARATLWHESLTRDGAAELNERFTRRFGCAMTGRDWAAWMAVSILWEAVARQGNVASTRLLGHADRFEGHKGRPLVFDARRHLVQPLYVVAGGRVVLVAG